MELKIFLLDLLSTLLILVVKEGGGGVAAIFDSQTENFLSQKGQSTSSTETEFCWLSTQ